MEYSIWNQEARLQLKSAIEAHAAQSRSRRGNVILEIWTILFKKVMTPVNPGHYADAKSVDELTVNPDFTLRQKSTFGIRFGLYQSSR